ncbi:MAG: ABC transporter ATP-binding protein [Thermoplasmata archaeon]|nr:MAG: ABC transporter ATP-binding protein [Thermoplasmata archaeon]
MLFEIDNRYNQGIWSEAMIEADNIVKRYPIRGEGYNWRKAFISAIKRRKQDELTALYNVSLDVQKSEIVGILGPNGAGKTTLIKILAGLLVPDSGKASVNYYDVIKNRKQVRTSLNLLRSGGWVMFDYKLTVYNNLKYWGIVQGLGWNEIKPRIEEVLEIVRLKDKINEYPENLSAGMRQKMCLALCLLSDRPIYLLDEPTANIDPYSANFIREFVRDELAGNGKTVLLATHNLWEAEMICDRIAILLKGCVVLFDKTEVIKGRREGGYILINVLNLSDDLVEDLSCLDFVRSVFPSCLRDSKGEDQYQLEIHGDVEEHLQELLEVCFGHTEVGSMETKDPSLNDIFMEMMERIDSDKAQISDRYKLYKNALIEAYGDYGVIINEKKELLREIKERLDISDGEHKQIDAMVQEEMKPKWKKKAREDKKAAKHLDPAVAELIKLKSELEEED